MILILIIEKFMATPIKEFYLTIKCGNDYCRFLKCEEGQDQGFYIRHILALHTKSSYHSNFNKKCPPYEHHIYGCDGKIIYKSIDQRKIFITDYEKRPFSEFHFNKIQNGIEIKSPTSEDIIYDLKNKNITGFHFAFFSSHRRDLLRDWDNAIVKQVNLIGYDLIIGLFWKTINEK